VKYHKVPGGAVVGVDCTPHLRLGLASPNYFRTQPSYVCRYCLTYNDKIYHNNIQLWDIIPLQTSGHMHLPPRGGPQRAKFLNQFSGCWYRAVHIYQIWCGNLSGQGQFCRGSTDNPTRMAPIEWLRSSQRHANTSFTVVFGNNVWNGTSSEKVDYNKCIKI